MAQRKNLSFDRNICIKIRIYICQEYKFIYQVWMLILQLKYLFLTLSHVIRNKLTCYFYDAIIYVLELEAKKCWVAKTYFARRNRRRYTYIHKILK